MTAADGHAREARLSGFPPEVLALRAKLALRARGAAELEPFRSLRLVASPHRFEAVADSVAGVDERMRGSATVDLLAQLADENVDGSVPVRVPSSPQGLQQLVARHDAAALAREHVEQTKLRRS